MPYPRWWVSAAVFVLCDQDQELTLIQEASDTPWLEDDSFNTLLDSFSEINSKEKKFPFPKIWQNKLKILLEQKEIPWGSKVERKLKTTIIKNWVH